MNNKLTTKVQARNKVNALVNEWATPILNALAPFVGTSICLKGGGYCVKLRNAIRDLIEAHGLRYREDMPINSDQAFTLEACVRSRRISV